MTLIIEDGTTVANANSYVTEQEYYDWADIRFGSGRSTAPACDEDAEGLILRAMDYFEAQNFQGLKVDTAQSLQWPRSNVVIDNFSIETTEIPKEVKNSIYEAAYAEESGNSELSSVDRKVKSEKIASIAVEYADNSSSTNINRSISSSIKKLLEYSGGLRVFRV